MRPVRLSTSPAAFPLAQPPSPILSGTPPKAPSLTRATEWPGSQAFSPPTASPDAGGRVIHRWVSAASWCHLDCEFPSRTKLRVLQGAPKQGSPDARSLGTSALPIPSPSIPPNPSRFHAKHPQELVWLVGKSCSTSPWAQAPPFCPPPTPYPRCRGRGRALLSSCGPTSPTSALTAPASSIPTHTRLPPAFRPDSCRSPHGIAASLPLGRKISPSKVHSSPFGPCPGLHSEAAGAAERQTIVGLAVPSARV